MTAATDIKAGMVFDTPFETGCRVMDEPNEDGGFYAYDSEGVLCWFGVDMVRNLRPDPDAEMELQFTIHAREALGVVGFGPLTADENERVEARERYEAEALAEHEAEMAAGGRTICPCCGERSVTHRSVVTYGHAAHPEAEYSDLAECERCDYREV